MTPPEFLLNVHGRLSALQAAKALYAERLAPDFSVFEFLDTRETGLSRVLAWLLDPAGNHAQGDRFLRAFLDWLELPGAWLDGPGRIQVATEVPTTVGSTRGFMDIVVRMGDRAVAIENKPSAADQPEQVARYLDDLGATCPGGHCLLYLSGGGDGPAATSIGERRFEGEVAAGTLKVSGYTSLVAWLDRCTLICRAPSVTTMIEGMVAYVRREFGGMADAKRAGDLAGQIARSPEMIEAALAVFEAEAPLKQRLLDGVIDQVRDAIRARTGLHMVRADIGADKHSGLLIGLAAGATVGVGIQFDYARHGFLFYGVASEDGRPLPARVKTLIQALMGSEAGTQYWPVWKRVGPNDRHFPLSQQADREFWISARDGRLAAMVVRFVEEVEATLRQTDLLDAVRARLSGGVGAPR